MIVKNTTRVWLSALFIAWSFDLLFWRQEPGISFAVFVVLCLSGVFFLSLKEKLPPSRTSFVLLVPIFFFILMTVLREEPFTTFVNVMLTFVLLGLMALTFRGGKWLSYSLSDMIMGVFRLGISTVGLPISSMEKRKINDGNESMDESEVKPAKNRWIMPVMRGIVLALPVVAVLAALLASADPIFSSKMQQLFTLTSIQRLPEYIFRLLYILAGAYLLVGVFLHMLTVSHEEKLVGVDRPWLSPFLGWTEAVIIVAAVDGLFAFFVTVQFQYFFGGQANIAIEGFTYAEYARRGFSEMVIVAIISLLLLFGLGSITRRSDGTQRQIFSALGIGLVALVVVILFSAFQRLLLYEEAYGFSRIRTLTHVFIIWLAVLLVGTALIELRRKARLFGLMALAVALGFGITINLLNVDGFIVKENVRRTQDGSGLDMAYLVSLSDDSVPQLVTDFTDVQLPSAVRDDLGGVLACRAAIAEDHALHRADNEYLPVFTFPGYHVSRARAAFMMAEQAQVLKTYHTYSVDDGVWKVIVNGQVHNCYSFGGFD